jgi:hypothetical protein
VLQKRHRLLVFGRDCLLPGGNGDREVDEEGGVDENVEGEWGTEVDLEHLVND